jgi:hypothetical protein
MAIATTTTLLPLDRYAAIMGYDPVGFNNLRDEARASGRVWNTAAHNALAQYLSEAEHRLAGSLGYDIAPRFRDGLVLFTAEPGAHDWIFTRLHTPYMRVQAFGTRAVELLADNVPVTFTGDTVTLSLTVDEPVAADDIQVFYRVADGAGEAAGETWQIRPLDVTVSGVTVTITGHKAQFATLETLAADTPADYHAAGSFVSAVDIYRVSVDPALPLTLTWDNYAVTGGDPTGKATQPGAAYVTDWLTGEFMPRPATYNGTAHVMAAAAYAGLPESVLVHYQAGYALLSGRIEDGLELAAARLANALSPSQAFWIADLAQTRWRHDRRLPTDADPLEPGEVSNPYGFTQAARYAWQVVRAKRLLRLEAYAV